MPQQPYVKEEKINGALGMVSGDAKKIFALIAYTSLLAANTVGVFSNLQALKDAAGVGPGVEQGAQILTECGGEATLLVVTPTTSAGSLTAGSATVTGLGTVTNSSSAPVDDFDLVVKILTGGNVATATFAYSLDEGRTWSPEIATGATYTIPGTGITLAFSSSGGAFAANDRFPFEAKGPSFTVNQLNTALDALLAYEGGFSAVHIAALPADAATAVSVVGAVQSKLTTAAQNQHLQAFAFVDGPEGVSNAALKTAIAALGETELVTLGGGFCPLQSLISSRYEKRPSSWPGFARACKVELSVALHATDVNDSGPLPRVGPLKSRATDPVTYSYHDETYATDKLDDGRIFCLRTWPGKAGVYINRGRTLALLTSDFTELHRLRVLQEAMRVGYDYVFPIVGSKLSTAAGGRLSAKDAKLLNDGGTAKLTTKLVSPGHADDAVFQVVETDDVLATELLRYSVRVRPKFHPNYIKGQYGFTKN